MQNNSEERRQNIEKRSNLLHQVRAFFYRRQVLEVDTPILSQGATPDLHLRSLKTQLQVPGQAEKLDYYLHTSPEYPMKRLLAEGSGDIYYLGKVFRDSDLSPRHQIEFTMLEWYRLGFSMQQLIDEVIELLQSQLGQRLVVDKVEQLSYLQLFQQYAEVENIFLADSSELQTCLKKHQVPEIVGLDDKDIKLWEQLVLTEVIEPQLGQDRITVVTHFPARDAALAQIDSKDNRQALRFEVFINGMELANGYQELQQADIYQQRFNESLQQRLQAGLPEVPLDYHLLDTLKAEGLPACSGVALGFDRLLMLQQGWSDINNAISFGIEQA